MVAEAGLAKDCDQCGGVGKMIIERSATSPGMRTRDCSRCGGTGISQQGWFETHVGRNAMMIAAAAVAATAVVTVVEIAIG